MFVGVRQGLPLDNRFTERDLWITRGSEEGLDLAGVESREKTKKVGHVERREARRDTQLWAHQDLLSYLSYCPRTTNLSYFLIWPRAGLLPLIVMWSLCVGMAEMVWSPWNHNLSSKSFIKDIFLLGLVQSQVLQEFAIQHQNSLCQYQCCKSQQTQDGRLNSDFLALLLSWLGQMSSGLISAWQRVKCWAGSRLCCICWPSVWFCPKEVCGPERDDIWHSGNNPGVWLFFSLKSLVLFL